MKNNQKLLSICVINLCVCVCICVCVCVCCVCMYKMVDISAETWKKADVSVIKIHENHDVNKTVLFLFCVSDVKKRWSGEKLYDLIDKEIKGKCGVTKMSGLTKQQIKKDKKDREKLIRGSKHSMYVSEDILNPIIMPSRSSDAKTIKFRSDLGFNQINLILKKEQSVVIPLLKSFSAEEIELQHKALKNKRVRPDMHFSEHTFALETDEKGHTDRNQNEENKRQTKIEKHSDRKFFHRINPYAEGFDIFLEIGKIQGYIAQSNEEKLKSKFAKELLSYVSSISKPLNASNILLKKYFLHCKYEKLTIKNKIDKNWKKTWNNVLFWV